MKWDKNKVGQMKVNIFVKTIVSIKYNIVQESYILRILEMAFKSKNLKNLPLKSADLNFKSPRFYSSIKHSLITASKVSTLLVCMVSISSERSTNFPNRKYNRSYLSRENKSFLEFWEDGE